MPVRNRLQSLLYYTVPVEKKVNFCIKMTPTSTESIWRGFYFFIYFFFFGSFCISVVIKRTCALNAGQSVARGFSGFVFRCFCFMKTGSRWTGGVFRCKHNTNGRTAYNTKTRYARIRFSAIPVRLASGGSPQGRRAFARVTTIWERSRVSRPTHKNCKFQRKWFGRFKNRNQRLRG